jgi:small subunit ribosomal protein S4e
MVHVKVQTTPKTWKVKRKGDKFSLHPNPGKQYGLSMPLSLVLKNLLKYCKTTKEVKTILNENNIVVDGKRRKDHRYPVGLMDVISLGDLDEHYRMVFTDKGKLALVKIDKKESDLKPSKIIGKRVLGKDEVQLNMFDSRNVTVKKDEYAVGDTVLLRLPKQDAIETIKVEKGNLVFLYKGKKRGIFGTVEELSGTQATIKTDDGNVIHTNKEYVFGIGKQSQIVKVSE